MIKQDRELLAELQSVTEQVVQFLLSTVGADPISAGIQRDLGERMMVIGRTLRDRANAGEPVNGIINGIVSETIEGAVIEGALIEGELEDWADRLDAAVDATAAYQDRDNAGAADLLSAVALLAESTRALARGDIESAVAHTESANDLLAANPDRTLRPGPDSPGRHEA